MSLHDDEKSDYYDLDDEPLDFDPYDAYDDPSEELEDETESDICSNCSGSGEGMHDGSTCYVCKGSGSTKPCKKHQ
jgi:RecJ-like exonuclease